MPYVQLISIENVQLWNKIAEILTSECDGDARGSQSLRQGSIPLTCERKENLLKLFYMKKQSVCRDIIIKKDSR